MTVATTQPLSIGIAVIIQGNSAPCQHINSSTAKRSCALRQQHGCRLQPWLTRSTDGQPYLLHALIKQLSTPVQWNNGASWRSSQQSRNLPDNSRHRSSAQPQVQTRFTRVHAVWQTQHLDTMRSGHMFCCNNTNTHVVLFPACKRAQHVCLNKNNVYVICCSSPLPSCSQAPRSA
jgi:hypothetical protein